MATGIDFLGYVLQGLFTGFGVVTGTHIYDMYVRKHMEKSKEVIGKITPDSLTPKLDSDRLIQNMLGKNN